MSGVRIQFNLRSILYDMALAAVLFGTIYSFAHDRGFKGWSLLLICPVLGALIGLRILPSYRYRNLAPLLCTVLAMVGFSVGWIRAYPLADTSIRLADLVALNVPLILGGVIGNLVYGSFVFLRFVEPPSSFREQLKPIVAVITGTIFLLSILGWALIGRHIGSSYVELTFEYASLSVPLLGLLLLPFLILGSAVETNRNGPIENGTNKTES